MTVELEAPPQTTPPLTSEAAHAIGANLKRAGGFDFALDLASIVVASYQFAFDTAFNLKRAPELQDHRLACRAYIEAFDSGTTNDEINRQARKEAAAIRGYDNVSELLADEVKAEKNLQEAEDAANAARAQRLAIESEISACHAAKGRLLDRLNSCKRDFAAERESHLQTVAELYGRSEDSPATASRLRLALNNLSDLPVLEKVVPKLRKQLEADLSKVEARLTELTTGKK